MHAWKEKREKKVNSETVTKASDGQSQIVTHNQSPSHDSTRKTNSGKVTPRRLRAQI